MSATVEMIGPPSDRMTIDEGLAFIERTRRQLDNFDKLPNPSGRPIDPEEEASIRRQLDELEADLTGPR
jgi:hypothetical protein